MIDYKEAKSYLIRAMIDYGFKENKEKTCRAWRVFSNGSETLIVRRNQQGEYDFYTNKTCSNDCGDTVAFLMRQKLNKITGLSAEEFCTIEAELKRIGKLSLVKNVINNTHNNEQTIFDIANYNVERWNATNPSSTISQFFNSRGIDPKELGEFRSALGVLVSDKGFKMPFFYWQNLSGMTLGGQYKYIKDAKCEKRFLKGTDRTNSLWMTDPQGKCGLFVAEDPLDAIAHCQLNPNSNLAYVCTGGTSTQMQRDMIHTLSVKHDLCIILGNDNDLAGQVENYKLMHNGQQITYDINRLTETVTVNIEANKIAAETLDANTWRGQYTWSKDELIDHIKQECDYIGGFTVAIPTTKDWNDDLRDARKSANLKRVKDQMLKNTQKEEVKPLLQMLNT